MKLLGWSQIDADGTQHFGFGIKSTFIGGDGAMNAVFPNPKNYTVDVILPRITVKKFDLAMADPPYGEVIIGSHTDNSVSRNFGVFEGISIHDLTQPIYLEVWLIEPTDSVTYPIG